MVATSAADVCSSDHILVVVVCMLAPSNTARSHIAACSCLTVHAHLLSHALGHILASFDAHFMIHGVHLPQVLTDWITTRGYHTISAMV